MIKPERFLTDSDCESLFLCLRLRYDPDKLTHTYHKFRLLLLLMLDAGLRVGELVQLRLPDLFVNCMPVDRLSVSCEISKNHEDRVIPCTERLRTAIADFGTRFGACILQTSDEYVFGSGNGDAHITTRAVQLFVVKLGKQSVGRKVTPHMLRHTFATRMMQHAPASVVQQLLGHKQLSSTQIYLHPTINDAIKAVAKLGV